MKENILVVHNHYQTYGGEDSVVRNEIELLKENNHKVFIYERDNNEIKKMNIFKKFLLLFSTIYSFETVRDIKKIIKNNKIDIIHVHNTLPLISASVYYVAKKYNIPVVQTVHNFRFICPNGLLYRDNKICEDCINNGFKCAIKHKCYRNSKFQTLLNVLAMKIHRKTGIYKYPYYICLTEFNKNMLLKQGQISENKIFVKPNFVETKYLFKRNDNISDTVVYIGRLDENKGIKFLVDAFENIKDINLHIYGNGDLKDYVTEKSKTNSNIIYYGFKDQKEIFEDLVSSLGLIMPSKCYEGFPMTIAESFSLGVPVISSDIGNHCQIIKDSKAGIAYKNNNVESLLEAIRDFKIKNYSYSNNAKQYYLKYLTSKTNYDLLINTYKRIINKKG